LSRVWMSTLLTISKEGIVSWVLILENEGNEN
jgi:hypothetical protein